MPSVVSPGPPEPLCLLQGGMSSVVLLGAGRGAPGLSGSSQGNLRKEFPSSHHTISRSLGQAEWREAEALPHCELLACAVGECMVLSLEPCSEPLSQLMCVSPGLGGLIRVCTHTRTCTGSLSPSMHPCCPSIPRGAGAPPGPSAAALHCQGAPSAPRGRTYTPVTAHSTGNGLT